MFLLAGTILTSTFTSTMANAGSSTPIGMAPIPRRPQPNLGPLKIQSVQPDLIQTSKSGPIQMPVKGVINNNLHLDSDPIFITCPSCFDLITTKVIYETNKETKSSCCSRFLNSNLSKDALHYCPNDGCHAFLGKYCPR